MSNENIRSDNDSQSNPRRGPLLLIGSLLWVMCLIGIVYGWLQWRQRILARSESQVVTPQSALAETDDDDGRSGKSIKLVPQKDGGFRVQEVTKDELNNPWSPDGIEDFSFTDTEGQCSTMTSSELISRILRLPPDAAASKRHDRRTR